MFDTTAPARDDRLMAEQAELPDYPLPAPQMPGCERIDVYLAQRGWAIRPRDVEVRDEVWANGFYGWVIFDSPEGTSYRDAHAVGTLNANERPVILGTFPDSELHIEVRPQ